MTLQSFFYARRHAGPRPTLPTGGRIVDRTHRTGVRRSNNAAQQMSVFCAHPGSGAIRHTLTSSVNHLLNIMFRARNIISEATP